MSRTALVVLIVLLVAGCGEGGIQTPTQNSTTIIGGEEVAPIQTEGDRFLLVPGPVYSVVEIPFVYENRTDGTSYYLAHCNGAFDFQLEKRIGDAWVHAHSPVLPACLSSPPIRIGPGERWRASIHVYVSIQEGIDPEPIALEPEGTYRIVLSTLSGFDASGFPFGRSLPKEDRVSNPFTLASAAPDRPAPVAADGFSFSATTRLLRVGPTFPATLTSWVTARNVSGERRSLRVPAECQVTLRAYREGRLAWDAARLGRCTPATPIELDVLPGDSLELYFETNEEEILGDSLPPGRYDFALALSTLDGRRLELPTTSGELAGFAVREVDVPHGQEVLVPGTDLRIQLVEVTNDDRCTGIGADGGPIQCFWAGRVRLVLRLSTPGLGSTLATLDTLTGPVVLQYGAWGVQFWGLSPERIPSDASEYVVRLRISG